MGVSEPGKPAEVKGPAGATEKLSFGASTGTKIGTLGPMVISDLAPEQEWSHVPVDLLMAAQSTSNGVDYAER